MFFGRDLKWGDVRSTSERKSGNNWVLDPDNGDQALRFRPGKDLENRVGYPFAGGGSIRQWG